jgi:hypothetical protein
MSRSDPYDPEIEWPFGAYDYDIAYGRLEQAMEVSIRATAARPLVVGDIYTFSRPTGLYDVEVTEVTMGEGFAWDARCRVIDFIRL